MTSKPLKLPLRIMFVTVLYDYDRPDRGYGPEYYNLYLCLREMVDEVVLYDYGTRLREIGREAMNREVLHLARKLRPAVALFTMATDQLDPRTIDQINEVSPTAYYAYDDTWRQDYVAEWAGHFRHVITTWTHGVANLARTGHDNGIFLPLACNHHVYMAKDLPPKYDVTFIGQFHPHRRWMLQQLKRYGFETSVWGTGWPNGRLGQDAMIGVFNQSRVNLNLANDISWDARYLTSSLSAIRNTLRSTKQYAAGNQRIMEINGCGGFQLTWYFEGLEHLYEIGEEIAIYRGPEQLAQRVDYYLAHSEEREAVARRGLERTLRDHTLDGRFRELFGLMGLPSEGDRGRQ
jgi:spore maturation protein CgeB